MAREGVTLDAEAGSLTIRRAGNLVVKKSTDRLADWQLQEIEGEEFEEWLQRAEGDPSLDVRFAMTSIRDLTTIIRTMASSAPLGEDGTGPDRPRLPSGLAEFADLFDADKAIVLPPYRG